MTKNNKKFKRIKKHWNNKAFKVHEFYQKYKGLADVYKASKTMINDDIVEDMIDLLEGEPNVGFYKVKTNLGDTISFYFDRYKLENFWKFNDDLIY